MTDRPVDDGAPLEGAAGAVSDLTVDPATADLGPEATDEQSVFVSGLLGTLRADDPPMPDDVVRRLDAVLAQERRARLEAAGVTSLPTATGEPGDIGDETPAAPVTVLPDRSARRGPTTRSFKVLGGVAAAVALVGIGAVIGTSGLGGQGTSGGSGSVVAAAGVPVADTATTYSKTGLEQQARDLVGSIGTRAYTVVTPQPAPPESSQTDAAAPAPPVSASANADDGVVTGQELAGCVAELTGRSDITPVVVDQGTYAGRPAEVIVLPSGDQPGAVDVWVVAAGCRQGVVELLDFRRLALVVSASPSP